MIGIHAWWKARAGERFWLGVPGRDEGREVLATSRAPGCDGPRAREPLVAHVRDGDAVLHYDEERQAIVAWSIAKGRVRKRNLYWSDGARGPNPDCAEPYLRPSWAIGLAGSTMLEQPVPIEHIARVQWDLFPALRALEDEVGEPLYYPFSMGSRAESKLVSGGVFKLPALFVESFDGLAEVSQYVAWAAHPSDGRALRSPFVRPHVSGGEGRAATAEAAGFREVSP
jgi:hypothetical protein